MSKLLKIPIFILLTTIVVLCPKHISAIGIFSKFPNNPIFLSSPTSWDTSATQNPIVLKNNSGFKMWYEGNDRNGWKIGYAFSENGINWNRINHPVIQIGDNDPNFTEIDNSNPYVIYNKDLNIYQMWYTSGGVNWSGGPDRFRLRYATSNDGISWTKYDTWSLQGSSGAWDSGGIARGISVIYQNGLYKLWYSGTNDGFQWRIGYAESTNGISWRKQNNGLPVISPTKTWELNGSISYPNVSYHNGLYEIFYAAGPKDLPTQILYATSTDGINWNKEYPNPILTGGPTNFDNIILSSPSPILLENGTTMLYYSGNAWAIGLATDGPIPPPPSNKVIIVPGVLGSWNMSIPDCTVNTLTDSWTSYSLSDNVYLPIAQQLSAIGKEPHTYHYDWRHNAVDNVQRFSDYLESLTTSSTETFDVVAHSFGGLVAQAYLEHVKHTDSFNRIHSLVTVGTPYLGAAKAYPPWARGTAWKDDDKMFKNAINVMVTYCASKKLKNQKAIIRELFPSVGNLQPRYPFLRLIYDAFALDPDVMTTYNTWTRDSSFSNPYYGSSISTVTGTGAKTLESIIAKPATAHESLFGWWIDGAPSKYLLTTLGDQSLRYADGMLPHTPNKTIPQDHIGIMNTTDGITAIFSLLNYDPPPLSLQISQPITSTLIIISNNTTTKVTDPSNQTSQDQAGIIGYANPKAGIYSIQTSQTGLNEGVVLVLQELSNGDSYQKEYTIPKNTKKTIDIVFDGVSQFK